MKDNILVLCHSNMHRSPFVAEFIRNSPYGDAYEVRDAGLHVDKEQRVPKSLQRAFQTVSQGSLKSHKSRPVGISDILWADKIIIMEPENKNDLLQMLGSLHLSDKPRYDQIVSKIISLAQIGGKKAVDDPHHYSPGTIEYGKVVLNLACLTSALLEMWEAQRSLSGGKNPKTGNRTTRNPQQAHSELDPYPPPHTIPHSLHLDMIYAFGAGQRKPPVEADSDECNRRLVLPLAAPGFRNLEQTSATEAGRHGTRLFNHQMVHVVHARCSPPDCGWRDEIK